MNKLKVIFYQLHPYEVPYKPRVSRDEVRKSFKAFDPLPSSIKSSTDSARSLLQELNTLRVNTVLLKTREAKAAAELKHFLEHSFGNIYDLDYYSGNYQLKTTMNYLCFAVILFIKLFYYFKNGLLFPFTTQYNVETLKKLQVRRTF